MFKSASGTDSRPDSGVATSSAGSGVARLLSLTMAGPLALALMLTPQLLGPAAASGAAHGGLSLAMLGMAGSFVHGFGYRPDHRVWRILFSPWVSWPLMVGGLWLALA